MTKANKKAGDGKNVSRETKLTIKQEKFCHKYFELGDAAKAYRAAYDTSSSDNVVRGMACELMKHPNVSMRIEVLRKHHEERHEITVDRILREMSRIAFFDARKTYDEDGNLKPIHEIDDDTAAAIAGMEIEVEQSKARKVNADGDDGEEIQQETTRTHKIKLADKQSALTTLARHLGMFQKDTVKLTGDKHNPVVHKIDVGTELADIMTLEQLEEIQRRVIAKSNAE